MQNITPESPRSPPCSSAPRSSSWTEFATHLFETLAKSQSRAWMFAERSRARDCAQANMDGADLIADFDQILDEVDRKTAAGAQLRETHVPRTGPLMALLRLARTFCTLENFMADLWAPGGILLLSTSDPEHTKHVSDLLDALIHAKPTKTSQDKAHNPHICKVAELVQNSKSSAQDNGALEDLSPDILAALETGATVIMVGSSLAGLPNALQTLSPRDIPLAPLDHEILCAFLLASFPKQACAAPEEIRKSLGEVRPETVCLMDMMMATRAGCTLQAAQILCERTRVSEQNTSSARLQDFPLPEKIQTALAQMVEDLRLWRCGRLDWSDVIRGLLFHGPTGSGKTEIARLAAQEADINLHAGSLLEWMSSGTRSGDATREMRKFFDAAAADAPCIVFIDEIDALGNRDRPHDHNSSWTDGVVTAFLNCVDGFEQSEGVILIAATNHLEKLDPAIMRPGRFDQIFRLDYPSRDQLPKVFRWHLKSDLPDADLARLSIRAIGMSGAMIGGVVREARAQARRKKEPLSFADLDRALSEHRPELPRSLQRVVAVHEAGHAIVAATTGAFKPVSVAILSHGGVAEQASTQNILCLNQVEAEIQTLLAGRAAEKLMFGAFSAGAGGSSDSDLARATERMAAVELSYGIGASGPIWLGSPDEMIVHLRRDPVLRAHIRERLVTLETAALRILNQNREILEELATALERSGVIEGPELDLYMSRLRARCDGTDIMAMMEETSASDQLEPEDAEAVCVTRDN